MYSPMTVFLIFKEILPAVQTQNVIGRMRNNCMAYFLDEIHYEKKAFRYIEQNLVVLLLQ